MKVGSSGNKAFACSTLSVSRYTEEKMGSVICYCSSQHEQITYPKPVQEIH